MILLLLQVKKVAYLSCDKSKKLKKYSHIFLMEARHKYNITVASNAFKPELGPLSLIATSGTFSHGLEN